MKSVAVLLAPGFEEGEAIVTIDILRRLNITVQTIACGESREVVSYHAISMVADSTLKASFDCTFDAVVLPGGHGGFGQPGFGERLREVLFVAPDRH